MGLTKTIGVWIANRIRSADIFDRYVQFNYRDKETFTTIAGGVASIALMLSMFSYAIVLANTMFSKSVNYASQSSRIVNLFIENNDYIVSGSQTVLAFGMLDKNRNPLTNDIVNYTVTNVKYTYDGDYTVYNNSDLTSSLTKWNSTTFPSDGKIPALIWGNLQWYNMQNARLKGSDATFEASFIRINVQKWVNGTKQIWQTTSTISSKLSGAYLYILTLSSYFDFSDISNPVKSVIQERISSVVNVESPLHYNSLLRLSNYELNDDIFGLSGSKSGQFYSFGSFDYAFTAKQDDNYFLSLEVKIDNQIDFYKRSLYSFTNFISSVGGSYGLLKGVLDLILVPILRRMIKHYILKHINEPTERYTKYKQLILKKYDNSHSRSKLDQESMSKLDFEGSKPKSFQEYYSSSF